jgi:hypothetical protein
MRVSDIVRDGVRRADLAVWLEKMWANARECNATPLVLLVPGWLLSKVEAAAGEPWRQCRGVPVVHAGSIDMMVLVLDRGTIEQDVWD